MQTTVTSPEYSPFRAVCSYSTPLSFEVGLLTGDSVQRRRVARHGLGFGTKRPPVLPNLAVPGCERDGLVVYHDSQAADLVMRLRADDRLDAATDTESPDYVFAPIKNR
jgi:hypothetical protein